MFDLVSTALADSGNASSSSETFASLLPILAIVSIFYFMIIKPQAKKQREQVQMINNLKRGDKVIVLNSIIGNIATNTEGKDVVELDLGNDIKIEVMRNSLSLFNKTEGKKENLVPKPSKDKNV